MKPTPKSILREVNTSASKGKKNIIINERLNETHRIAQKSESSLHSGERSNGSNTKDLGQRDYIREENGYSGVLGYSNRSEEEESASPSPQKIVGTSDDDDYESRLYPKYKSDANRSDNSSFKNRLVVNNQPSANAEFQRAHIRKLQQEREQELFSKGVRESADQLKEKWLEEKAKRSTGYDQYQSENTGTNEDDYGSRKIDTFGGRGVDKFDRIEDKISVLERDLNSYSKDLVHSTMEHEEKNKSLNRVYEDFEDRMKDLKDEISHSVLGNKSKDNFYSRGYSAEGGARSKEGSYLKEKKSSSSKLKSGNTSHLNKSAKSTKKSATLGKSLGKTNKAGTSLTFKKMQEEIERLRNENEDLKDKLGNQVEDEKKKTRKEKAGVDIDREKELLQTIERIKGKLRRSITKKIQQERARQVGETKEEAATESFGRNYTAYGFHYKDILRRKAYEDSITAKENYDLLYKGMPTTYKTYDGPIISQKLSKSKK